MEEASKKRLERLQSFALGVTEPILVGVPISDTKNSDQEGEEKFTTVESLAHQVLSGDSFAEDPSEPIKVDKKQNWDLKKEYVKKCEPLQIENEKTIEKILREKFGKSETE
jgi:hypothetical protein